MLVIPAIDLKDGAVVRLHQGRADRETRYAFDPVAVARGWQEQGAAWLHVVDLDGALSGRPQHLAVLQRLVNAIDVSIQFGGGLRTRDDIELALLRAGYSANADIIINESHDVLTVPERVVYFQNDSTYVKVPGTNGIPEIVMIETGLSDAIRVEVKSGLDEDQVILEKPQKKI